MTDGPMQPDEPGFPETRDALRLLASGALPAEARARHLHAIRERAAELGAPPAPARRRLSGLAALRTRRAAAIAGAWMSVASMGTGVAAAASMDDLPGEPLYGLKRTVESVRLRLPGDNAEDVRRRLELAERRLAEAEALDRDEADAEELLDGVLAHAGAMLAQAEALAGEDHELAAAVAAVAGDAHARLTRLLEDGLPERAADRAREAIEAATERAQRRDEPAGTDDDGDEEDDRGDGRGRGRGRGGDDDRAAPAGTPGSPPRAAPTESESEDDDSGRGRGRGRGGDEREDDDQDEDGNRGPSGGPGTATSPGEPDDDRSGSNSGSDEHEDEDRSGSNSGPDDENDDDSGRGRGRGGDEPDDDEPDDDEPDDDEPHDDEPDEDEDDEDSDD